MTAAGFYFYADVINILQFLFVWFYSDLRLKPEFLQKSDNRKNTGFYCEIIQKHVTGVSRNQILILKSP